MWLISRLTMVRFAVIGLVLTLFFSGCEPYGSVNFDNQTIFPIQVDIQSVPLDFQGTSEFDYLPGDFIKPGEHKEYGTHARRGRSVGTRSKYLVSVLSEADGNKAGFYPVPPLPALQWHVKNQECKGQRVDILRM